MANAVRAIIIEDGKLLVMHRNKYGSEYFTLVGGQVADGEGAEQALAREVKEETGLDVTNARFVFYEDHVEPYNKQYIYVCEVAPHADVAVQAGSEEGQMNKLDMNTHSPLWVNVRSFSSLPFRTPNLQIAIVSALRKGFPPEPIRL
jgi:ADP-ribose pyrophosphatase YjhB (NUDIX family)